MKMVSKKKVDCCRQQSCEQQCNCEQQSCEQQSGNDILSVIKKCYGLEQLDNEEMYSIILSNEQFKNEIVGITMDSLNDCIINNYNVGEIIPMFIKNYKNVKNVNF